MPKIIKMTLDVDSIQRAINELNAYKTSLKSKIDRFRYLFAERVAWSAASGFSNALVSDVFSGGEPPSSDVYVDVSDMGDVTVVIANGTEAVFIEFGAGVYYNGAAGSSPHQWGEKNGYLIGEYGKGFGKRNTWVIGTNEDGSPILTHGTPAAMPMYHGLQDALMVTYDLAKEVFGSD